MIWFCYFWKKLFFVLGVAHRDTIFAQVGPKKKVLEVLANFFRNYWIPIQVFKINGIL